MDKSLGTLSRFWGVFQFTQVQPLPSPHKQCWTRVSRIFSEFQLCIGWRGGGGNARTFKKWCTVLTGNREMTEKYEYCSTVPRAFVQDFRLVTMSRKSDHVTPLLFQLHWLPVDQRIEFKVLLFTYKAMQGLAPQYLSDLLEPYSPLRSLRSAAKLLPNSFSFYLRTYGYKSFSVCAPRL